MLCGLLHLTFGRPETSLHPPHPSARPPSAAAASARRREAWPLLASPHAIDQQISQLPAATSRDAQFAAAQCMHARTGKLRSEGRVRGQRFVSMLD